MPRIGGEQTDGVQAVVLTLRILEHLAERGGDSGVTALADALGTTKSRIFRHLQTLVQQGYVARSAESDRYRIGTNLISLGLEIAGKIDLASAATSVLRHLRDTLGHSAVVSRLEEDGMRVLATARGTSSIEIGVRAGSLLSFHGSAQGKVALAFGPEALRTSIYRSRLNLLTPRTIVSHEALRREIELVRQRGWAAAPNEALLGLNTLAAPILDSAGYFVGAVAINDSIQFIEEEPAEAQISEIVRAAAEISRELGHANGRPPLDK